MNLMRLFKGFKLKAVGADGDKVGATDLGVLKVALMVAAIDGRITDEEYAAFMLLAKKSRGYGEEAASAALREAQRSAGFLLMTATDLSDAALAKEFVKEAEAALPRGFSYLSLEEIRRAVVTWIVMGMSDGDYSARERKCIEALRRRFAEMTVRQSELEDECWSRLPKEMRAQVGKCRTRKVELVSKDFVGKVEEVIAQLGDMSAASKQLNALIVMGRS